MAPKKAPEQKQKRAVVVTTENRGVFFGFVEDDSKAPNQITLSRCRNCVYWPASTRGFIGLTTSGPLAGSKVGPAAPEMTLYKVTSIATCTEEAIAAWEKAVWG
jgi:hypothetical protein